MKVIISPNPGAVEFSRQTVNYLWDHHRETFDDLEDPLEVRDLIGDNPAYPFEQQFRWAVERDGYAYFLNMTGRTLRTLPWLIHVIETGEEPQAARYAIVDVDEKRPWYFYIDDCGAESIIYEDTEERIPV